MKKQITKIATLTLTGAMLLAPVTNVFAADDTAALMVTEEAASTVEDSETSAEANEISEDMFGDGTESSCTGTVVVNETNGNDDGSTDSDTVTGARGIFGTSYIVTASSLYVRSGPGKKYGSIGSYAQGQTVKVYSVSEGWGRVKFNGGTGYVYMKYLKKI